MEEQTIEHLAKKISGHLAGNKKEQIKSELKLKKSGVLKLLELKLASCNLYADEDPLVLKAKEYKVPPLSTIDSKQRGKPLGSLPKETLEWLSLKDETSTKYWTLNIYASLVRLSVEVAIMKNDEEDIQDIQEVLNSDEYMEGYTLTISGNTLV